MILEVIEQYVGARIALIILHACVKKKIEKNYLFVFNAKIALRFLFNSNVWLVNNFSFARSAATVE